MAGLSGLDFAFTDNTAVYHTKVLPFFLFLFTNFVLVVLTCNILLLALQNDKIELIKPGSLQHLGENMLAFLIRVASSSDLPKQGEEKSNPDSAVYFDILVIIYLEYVLTACRVFCLYHILMSFLYFYVKFSGEVYDCIPAKFCEYAICFSDHAVDSYMGYVFDHGWLSGSCVAASVVFEYHPLMDILSSFLCSCCLHTTLDFFITRAVCFKPIDGSWTVCVACGVRVNNWSACGLYFPSEEIIEPKREQNASLTKTKGWFSQA